MALTLLEQVQAQVANLEDLKAQRETLQNQQKDKINETAQFYRNWQNTCNHLFYEKQRLAVTTFVTTGYHCCLCGMNLLHNTDGKNPTNCIGKVHISSYCGIDDSGKSIPPKQPEYLIPPKYRAEVNSKKEQIHKMEEEIATLDKKIKELTATIEPLEKELDSITHFLNGYFHYPETVYREPFHWGPDDWNYEG